MQAPTHTLAGVIIQRLIPSNRFKAIAMVLLFLIAILFHGIFDKIAKSTYHPPNADFSDPFWLTYHLIVALVTILFLYIWGSEYKWGIIFSLLPDVDWIFIHAQNMLQIDIPFYREPHLHNAINYFIDHVYPFCYLNLLPDNRLLPLACIWEILFTALLLLVIRTLDSRRRNIHF